MDNIITDNRATNKIARIGRRLSLDMDKIMAETEKRKDFNILSECLRSDVCQMALSKIGVDGSIIVQRLETEMIIAHSAAEAQFRALGARAIKLAGQEPWNMEWVQPFHMVIAGIEQNLIYEIPREAFLTALQEVITGIISADMRYPHLANYSKNLTLEAFQGKIEEVIGRHKETRRVMEILSRKTKNNPVLVGCAGVGKTAIVEGLAKKIVAGEVPETLKNKVLYALDLTALMASTGQQGAFEERMLKIMEDIENAAGEVIVFIDELHMIMGAGSSNGMDMSNILKPALARGEIKCIGATTPKEFEKYIEKDAALERRFMKVEVEEPTVDEAIAILRGIKENYAIFHGISIMDEAVQAAVNLSHRYIPSRYLPDKAIDLLDESSARLALNRDSMPIELETLQKELLQLEVAHTAISKDLLSDEDELELHQRAVLEKEKVSLMEQIQSKQVAVVDLKTRWENQKSLNQSLKGLKIELKQTQHHLEMARNAFDLTLATELETHRIPRMLGDIENLSEQLSVIEDSGESLLPNEKLEADDIAQAVCRWTGIPVDKLNAASELEKLQRMEKDLQEKIIGQDKVISDVVRSIKRAKTGLSAGKKPLGSHLFLGKTGTGKTYMARNIAEMVFDKEDAMLRIDMSEYMESHSVAKLIGSPPGYVGYDDGGGILSDFVRNKPYSLILLDEIEKAHPAVLTILLQILDNGQSTDNKGRKVDFRNTIIIMTSNMGVVEILNNPQIPENMRSEMFRKLIVQRLKPELVNRIDGIHLFNDLGNDSYSQIITLALKDVKARVREQQMEMEWTPELVSYMTSHLNVDNEFGARIIQRVVQSQIEDAIAEAIVAGMMTKGDKIIFTAVEGQGISFNIQKMEYRQD